MVDSIYTIRFCNGQKLAKKVIKGAIKVIKGAIKERKKLEKQKGTSDLA